MKERGHASLQIVNREPFLSPAEYWRCPSTEGLVVTDRMVAYLFTGDDHDYDKPAGECIAKSWR